MKNIFSFIIIFSIIFFSYSISFATKTSIDKIILIRTLSDEIKDLSTNNNISNLLENESNVKKLLNDFLFICIEFCNINNEDKDVICKECKNQLIYSTKNYLFMKLNIADFYYNIENYKEASDIYQDILNKYWIDVTYKKYTDEAYEKLNLIRRK